MNSEPNTAPNTAPNRLRPGTRTAPEPSSSSSSSSASVRQHAGASSKPLRSGDLIPAVRSATSSRACSARHEEPADYLASPEWRARRNRALAAAGYRCGRCHANRDLITVERIGGDIDAVLDVLCRGCAESGDADAKDIANVRNGAALYARIVSDILSERRLTHFSDVVEEAKRRCVVARIPYQTDELHAAITRLGSRFTDDPPEHAAKPCADDRPLSRAEAADILASLAAAGLIKPMPAAPMISRRAADRRIVARQLAALVLDQVQRCEEAESAAADHDRTDND